MLRFDGNHREADFSKVRGTEIRYSPQNGNVVNVKCCSGCLGKNNLVACGVDPEGKTIYCSNQPSDTYTR